MSEQEQFEAWFKKHVEPNEFWDRMPAYDALYYAWNARAQQQDNYKAALQDACLNLHCDFVGDNPRQTINNLLAAHEAIALDPRISEQAAKLIAQQQDHGETVLKVQKALGFTDECFVDPDAILNRIWKAQQPVADQWEPSGKDYDRNIHCNPYAKAWADFFVETYPNLSDKHDVMLGWFANAMMAMYDHVKSQQPVAEQEPVAWVNKLGIANIEWNNKFDLPNSTPLYTSPQPAQPVVPVTFSFYKAGAYCMSEDECIVGGVSFSDYERGVADAIDACERIVRQHQQTAAPAQEKP